MITERMFTLAARNLFYLKNANTVTLCDSSFKLIIKTMSTCVENPWSYIYIASPDAPIYFKRKSIQTESESRISKNEPSSKLLTEPFKKYILFANNESTNSIASSSYVNSAIQSHLAYRQKDLWQSCTLSHAVLFNEEFAKSKTTDHISRGVFCCCTSPEQHLHFQSQLLDFLNANRNFVTYEILKCSNKENAYIMSFVGDGNNSEENLIDLDVINYPEMKDSMECKQKASPIFSISEICPVFHSYGESLEVLEKLADVPEVKELLDIATRSVTIATEDSSEALSHPFIVVEGMDATGKTTLTKMLEEKICAARYCTPPPEITHLRAFFDKYPEIVRRAYYSLGNYIVAGHIIQECKTRPVIMDRFWHSTAAYGIANEASSGDMPTDGHFVYRWPKDLLKPSIVLFLTVSEDMRKQRLQGRGITATFEEKSLDKDQLFRQRLCDSYRRMRSPSLLEIDAGGTVEEVQTKAVEVLAANGVNLNRTNN